MKLLVLFSSLFLLAAGSPEFSGLNDGQILAITAAANQADIATGNLAASRTKDPKLQKFARQMVEQHSTSSSEAKEIATSLSLKPEATGTSDAITADARDTIGQLRKLKGRAFDQAYANYVVGLHEQLLKLLDVELIPGAKSPELKTLLQKLRPQTALHLSRSMQLQASLGVTPHSQRAELGTSEQVMAEAGGGVPGAPGHGQQPGSVGSGSPADTGSVTGY